MLQRIQTVWMLLAAICAALTFKFAFYSGNVTVGPNGHLFQDLTALPQRYSGSILVLIVTVIVLVGSLINIFYYKNRKKQIWITIGLIFLSLLNIFLYYRVSGVPPFIEGNYGLGAILSLLIPVFLILAVRGIVKDNKLVKSADRLR